MGGVSIEKGDILRRTAGWCVLGGMGVFDESLRHGRGRGQGKKSVCFFGVLECFFRWVCFVFVREMTGLRFKVVRLTFIEGATTSASRGTSAGVHVR